MNLLQINVYEDRLIKIIIFQRFINIKSCFDQMILVYFNYNGTVVFRE